MQLVLIQGEILWLGHGGNGSAGAGTNGGSLRTLTGMGAGCVSLGVLQLHSPLTTLSILFQNKVLTVDGVKVKLQVCPHVPGSISLAALGVQRWTKPLRGQRSGDPSKWGSASILSCLLPWDSLMDPSGCSVPLAGACSGLGAVLATVIPSQPVCPCSQSCSSPLTPDTVSEPFAQSSVTQMPQAAACTLQTSCCIKD